MGDIRRSFTRTGNRIAVWMYRRWDGRYSSGSREIQVLMITTPGRRTGEPRSTCVRFLAHPDGYLVWGTGSGSPHDPDWFQNLRASEVAEVRVGSEQFRALRRELTGPERDSVWRDVVLTQLPSVARYARKAARVIPVAVLSPIDPPT
jgi:deazaflavin-dependent oxidoreductase (nitroreductase family)